MGLSFFVFVYFAILWSTKIIILPFVHEWPASKYGVVSPGHGWVAYSAGVGTVKSHCRLPVQALSMYGRTSIPHPRYPRFLRTHLPSFILPYRALSITITSSGLHVALNTSMLQYSLFSEER